LETVKAQLGMNLEFKFVEKLNKKLDKSFMQVNVLKLLHNKLNLNILKK